jgi:hypothetical protein
MTIAAQVEVAGPYPVSWDRVSLVACIITPPTSQSRKVVDGELASRWHTHAARSTKYAALLDRLLEQGWHLSCDIPYVVATRDADTIEQARRLVLDCAEFPRGFPIEIRVRGRDTAACAAGGMQIDCPEHHEVWPPRTLPAIVATEPTGTQRTVNNEAELRAAILDGLEELAVSLEGRDDPRVLQGSDLADAVRRIGEEVAEGAPIPRAVAASVPTPAPWDLNAPRYTLKVLPVSAAIWSGVSMEMGVVSLTVDESVGAGLAGELSMRGQDIARKCEAFAILTQHLPPLALEPPLPPLRAVSSPRRCLAVLRERVLGGR